MSSTPNRAPAGATLLHRLQAMAAGVAKHKADPGFPAYFATVDLAVEYDEVANALLGEKEAIAAEHALRQSLVPQAADMHDLYVRGVAAIESFYGLDGSQLTAFGVKPRKGPYSGRTKAARAAKRARKARKATGAGTPAKPAAAK